MIFITLTEQASPVILKVSERSLPGNTNVDLIFSGNIGKISV